MLCIRDTAPDFELPDQFGKLHKLSSYRGKKVILYFYPKDLTPGCTTEACEFRDSNNLLTKKNIIVLGISADKVDLHKKFSDKYKLNFPLLADMDKKAINAYGVWGKKKFLGKEYYGILRTTFVINERGKIEKIFEKVRPEGHALQILSTIKSGA